MPATTGAGMGETWKVVWVSIPHEGSRVSRTLMISWDLGRQGRTAASAPLDQEREWSRMGPVRAPVWDIEVNKGISAKRMAGVGVVCDDAPEGVRA